MVLTFSFNDLKNRKEICMDVCYPYPNYLDMFKLVFLKYRFCSLRPVILNYNKENL